MIARPADSVRPPTPAKDEGHAAGVYGMLKRWHPLKPIIIATFVVIVMLTVTLGYIQKGLWMQQLGYTGIFWKLFTLRWGLSSAAFVIVALYLWINVRLASRSSAMSRAGLPIDANALAKLDIKISPTAFRLATSMTTAAAALVFAYIFYGQWDTYLRFRNGGSFGLSDPLFGVDLGYYVPPSLLRAAAGKSLRIGVDHGPACPLPLRIFRVAARRPNRTNGERI